MAWNLNLLPLCLLTPRTGSDFATSRGLIKATDHCRAGFANVGDSRSTKCGDWYWEAKPSDNIHGLKIRVSLPIYWNLALHFQHNSFLMTRK